MGKIIVHEFMSLDGVIEDPRWTFDYPFVPEMGGAIAQAMGSCEALLLGRKTFEMFEPAWSKRTAAEDPGAPFMNDSPKYVVSSTLKDPTWNNSKVIGPYDAVAIRKLKDTVGGGIYISGSGQLVRALIADELADEFHLFIYPLTLGSGARIFADGGRPTKLKHVGSESFSNGVLHAVYERAVS